jgi:hypothetical protein
MFAALTLFCAFGGGSSLRKDDGNGHTSMLLPAVTFGEECRLDNNTVRLSYTTRSLAGGASGMADASAGSMTAVKSAMTVLLYLQLSGKIKKLACLIFTPYLRAQFQ